MNKLTSSLSALSAVAAMVGAAACGGSQARPASPTSAQGAPSTPVSSGSNQTASNVNPSSSETSSGNPSGAAANSGSIQAGAATSSSPASGAGSLSGSIHAASGSNAAANGSGATSASAANGSGQYGATNTMGGLPDTSGLNDSQIAAMVASIHEGEIQQAQLAAAKAFSTAVKRFAEHMISAHQNMSRHDAIVLSREKMTPSDNAISNQLRTDAQDRLSALQSIHGRDFDRQYIDGQVRDHTKALELLIQVMPTVKNPDLKEDLQAARTQVEDHLQMAKKVQQQLQTGASGN